MEPTLSGRLAGCLCLSGPQFPHRDLSLDRFVIHGCPCLYLGPEVPPPEEETGVLGRGLLSLRKPQTLLKGNNNNCLGKQHHLSCVPASPVSQRGHHPPGPRGSALFRSLPGTLPDPCPSACWALRLECPSTPTWSLCISPAQCQMPACPRCGAEWKKGGWVLGRGLRGEDPKERQRAQGAPDTAKAPSAAPEAGQPSPREAPVCGRLREGGGGLEVCVGAPYPSSLTVTLGKVLPLSGPQFLHQEHGKAQSWAQSRCSTAAACIPPTSPHQQAWVPGGKAPSAPGPSPWPDPDPTGQCLLWLPPALGGFLKDQAGAETSWGGQHPCPPMVRV